MQMTVQCRSALCFRIERQICKHQFSEYEWNSIRTPPMPSHAFTLWCSLSVWYVDVHPRSVPSYTRLSLPKWPPRVTLSANFLDEICQLTGWTEASFDLRSGFPWGQHHHQNCLDCWACWAATYLQFAPDPSTVFSFLGQIEAYIIPILQHQKSTSNAATIPVEKTIPLPTAAACRQPTAQWNRRRHSASLRWSTHFSSMHGCMFPTYSTRKYPKHSDSQSWGTHFHNFPTIFYGAFANLQHKKAPQRAITASYSTRTRPRQTAITEEAFIFPPYTAVCCQPTAPEATVKAATFPTELL